LLPERMASLITCKVHPTVLLQIIDAYERRPESKDKAGVSKVIGTLLGTVEKGVVEVANCYAVPHSEAGDEAQIQNLFNKEMYELVRKSNVTEVPVGWFCTNTEVNELSIVYHNYYQKFVAACQQTRDQLPVVLLTLDTSMQTGRMGIKCYIRIRAGIPKEDREQCTIFVPLNAEMTALDAEQIGISLVQHGRSNPKRTVELFSGVEQINKTTDQMLEWIKKIQAYINEVLAGNRPPDSAVGRRLMELVSNVSHVQPREFENMLASSMKDYLMVVYLAQLAKTQLSLNEKLVTM